MKRLGMYTGKIYEPDETGKIKSEECTVPLSENEAKDEQYIANKYNILHSSWCAGCVYCSLNREHIKKETDHE